jgi:hypothetical protein
MRRIFLPSKLCAVFHPNQTRDAEEVCHLVDLGIRERTATDFVKVISHGRVRALVFRMLAELLTGNHGRNGRLGDQVVREGAEDDTIPC